MITKKVIGMARVLYLFQLRLPAHGMSERGMGSWPSGRFPEYEDGDAIRQRGQLHPVLVKLTPNVADVRLPRAQPSRRRGRCRSSTRSTDHVDQ